MTDYNDTENNNNKKGKHPQLAKKLAETLKILRISTNKLYKTLRISRSKLYKLADAGGLIMPRRTPETRAK